jgi:UDP-N-acetylmuramate: L-alanyl-gamma-D-glutamyl-meso-diaminopimelate ligase
MYVHLVGVAGTGMGALAGLLKAAGHRVSGSDTAFHPPMGDALARWGIETKKGWDPANLEPRPDLVVVGNVCRKDNPEARAAIDGGIPYDSMPGAIEKLFLADRPGWVVAGTHGKTTTTTLLAYLAHRAGLDPGMLVGGIPKDFGESFRVGGPGSPGKTGAPFVIEGDEYDSAFFEKSPKFFRYAPRAVILGSIEHDHVDIYPDEASYVAAFDGLVARIPEDGVLVAWAGDPLVRRVASKARCRVVWFALSTDDVADLSPTWVAAPIGAQGGAQPFDLFVGGSSGGPVLSPLAGTHNVKNALAAIALVSEATGGTIPLTTLTHALRAFSGVKRRQELLAEAGGVLVYDDFAHHPTAVRETLAAIRARHPEGKLFAVFEPRSATACRKIHEPEYEHAFANADVSLLAPLGRSNVPEAERLDVAHVAAAIRAAGGDAEAPESHDAILAILQGRAKPGDVIVLMSNGDMAGLHDRVITALTTR